MKVKLNTLMIVLSRDMDNHPWKDFGGFPFLFLYMYICVYLCICTYTYTYLHMCGCHISC